MSVYLPQEGEYPPSGLGLIGPGGGTVRAQRPGDPFAGASITVPAGALGQEVVIVIRAGAGAPPIRGFIPVGPIFELEPAGLAFATDVTVTLPYRAALLPAGVPETQVQAYLAESSAWQPVGGQVDTAAGTVSFVTRGFSFVAPGVDQGDEFCEHELFHLYDCSESPEWAASGAWEIAEEQTHDASWHSDGELLYIECYQDEGAAGFLRVEQALAGAVRYAMEARARIDRFRPPSWLPYLYLSFGVGDGERFAAVGPGLPEEGKVYILGDAYQWYEAPGVTVDWSELQRLRIEVDRAPAAPDWRARLLLDGQQVLEVPYGQLAGHPAESPPYVFALGGDHSDTAWDEVSYTVCSEPDGDSDGLPDVIDNCPRRYNPWQHDSDGDGVGDACENPPQVTLEQPVEGLVTAASGLLVTGVASDADGDIVEVLVGGAAAAFSGSRFQAWSELAEGLNTIKVEVRDAGGNLARAEVHVYRGQEGELPEAFGVVTVAGGGGARVDDPGNSLYGAELVVPAGAVGQEEIVTISEQEQSLGYPDGRVAVGPVVVFGGPDSYQAEVQVKVPYSRHLLSYLGQPDGAVELWRYDESGGWERIGGESPEPLSGLVKAWTQELSPVQAFGEYPQDLRLETIAGGGLTHILPGGVPAVEAIIYAPTDVVGIGGGDFLFNEVAYSALDQVVDGTVSRILVDTTSGAGTTQTRYEALAYHLDGEGRRWLYYVASQYQNTDSVSAWASSTIRRRDLDSGADELVAGGGCNMADDGIAAANAAALGKVRGLDVDASGAVYFVEAHSSALQFVCGPRRGQRVRMIDPSGLVWTVAGTGEAGFNGDDGVATDLALDFPEDTNLDAIKMDSTVLFVADTNNHRVRAVNLSDTTSAVIGDPDTAGNNIVVPPGGMVTVVGEVGSDPADYAGAAECADIDLLPDGLRGRDTRLFHPRSVALSNGELFISDDCHRVLVMSLHDLRVTRVAGRPWDGAGPGFDGDGVGIEKKLYFPNGLFFDWGRRQLWIADSGNNRVRSLFVSDHDGDGIRDGLDNCIEDANYSQLDSDADGLGDACDSDDDNDGIEDDMDNCPLQDNFSQVDQDDDNVGDACDNCPADWNPPPTCTRDEDCEHAGGRCESGFCHLQLDGDGDGVGNACDNCPYTPNQDQADNDVASDPPSGPSSGGDACDVDDDNDGVTDEIEAFIGTNPRSADTDGDGIGDQEEYFIFRTDPNEDDSDGDGISDFQEYDANGDGEFGPDDLGQPGFDSDGDGRPDAAECNSCDSDGDGIPDHQDPVDDRDIPTDPWIVDAVWEVTSYKDHFRPEHTVDNETTNLKFKFRVVFGIQWNQALQQFDQFFIPYDWNPALMGEIYSLEPLPLPEGGDCMIYTRRSGLNECEYMNCVIKGTNTDIDTGTYLSRGFLLSPDMNEVWFDEDQDPPREDTLDQASAHYWEHRTLEDQRPVCGPSEASEYKYRHILAAGLANEPEINPEDHGTMRNPSGRYGGEDVAYDVPKENFIRNRKFEWAVQFHQQFSQRHSRWFPLIFTYDRELSFTGQIKFKKVHVAIHGDPNIIYLCDNSNGHNQWRADAKPPGGTFLWEIVEGQDKVEISGPNNQEVVELHSLTPSTSREDVLLRITYTTTEGVQDQDEKRITVQKPSSLGKTVLTSHTAISRGFIDVYLSDVLDQFGYMAIPVGDALGIMHGEENRDPVCQNYNWMINDESGSGTVLSTGQLQDTLIMQWKYADTPLPLDYKRLVTQRIWISGCNTTDNPVATRCQVFYRDGSNILPGSCIPICR